MKKHIPDANDRTFCGLRRTPTIACIDPLRDAIDDATCQNCHRSDDRRTRELYQHSDEYKQMQESS